MRAIVLMLALLLAAAAAQAQTASVSLLWDHIGATPAEVANYVNMVSVNGAAVPGAPTCVAKTTAPTGTTCKLPITVPAVGVHSISVKTKVGVWESDTGVTVDMATKPKPSDQPRVSVSITCSTAANGVMTCVTTVVP